MKGNHMRRIVSIIVIIIVSVAIAGCFPWGAKEHIDEDNAGSKMEEKLKKKYGKEFRVSNVKFVPGNYLVTTNPEYSGTACLAENNEETFDVVIEADSGSITDNYAKIIYDKEITNEVEGILKNINSLKSFTTKYSYALSDNTWSDPSLYMEYIKKEPGHVEVEAEFNVSTKEKLAKEIETIFIKFREKEINSNITFRYKENYVQISEFDSSRRRSYEDILEEINVWEGEQ